jgi:hypothetical protein
MDAAAQIGAAVEPLMATVKQENQAMQPAVDKFNQAADSPLPKAPNLEKSPEAAKSSDFGAEAKEYVTAMSLLSTLAGAFSRQHGTVALGAFASGMKGYQEGNKDALDQAHKEWKDANDKAITNNKFLTDQYREIIEDRKLTEQEQMEKIKILSTQYGDTITAQQQSVAAVEKLIDLQEKAKDRAAAAAAALQNRKDMMDYARELKNQPTLENAAIDDLADQYAKSGKIPTGLGYGDNANKRAVINRASEKYPNIDLTKAAQDFGVETKALKDFGTGKQGDTVRSFNVAFSHADVMSDLVSSLNSGSIPAINKAKQRFEQEFGEEAPTNIDAVKGILSDEINKAAVGGAGALSDREQIRESINKAGSPEQVLGALGVYKKLIGGQIKGLGKQYEQSTGRKDFDRFLDPSVKPYYEEKSPQGQVDQPSSSNIVHWDDLK